MSWHEISVGRDGKTEKHPKALTESVNKIEDCAYLKEI